MIFLIKFLFHKIKVANQYFLPIILLLFLSNSSCTDFSSLTKTSGTSSKKEKITECKKPYIINTIPKKKEINELWKNNYDNDAIHYTFVGTGDNEESAICDIFYNIVRFYGKSFYLKLKNEKAEIRISTLLKNYKSSTSLYDVNEVIKIIVQQKLIKIIVVHKFKKGMFKCFRETMNDNITSNVCVMVNKHFFENEIDEAICSLGFSLKKKIIDKQHQIKLEIDKNKFLMLLKKDSISSDIILDKKTFNIKETSKFIKNNKVDQKIIDILDSHLEEEK